jgi:aminoglycoside 6'-N-acetyltransferase I
MEKKETKHQMIRQLRKDEKIPYDLLLLADESLDAIDKYVFGSDIYVLEQENKIIAEYVLQSINKNEIEIKNMAVATDCQGQGIGKLLLRDATCEAKGKGFKTIVIGTGDAAFKQLYLYQKEGFEVFNIKKNFFSDNYPKPIYENGIQLKHMIMLKKELKSC